MPGPIQQGLSTWNLASIFAAATTKRSAALRTSEVRNVMDFGADNTGIIDCQPAITAALTAKGGSVLGATALFFPAGTYLINTSVDMLGPITGGGAPNPWGVIIYGVGHQSFLISNHVPSSSAVGTFTASIAPGPGSFGTMTITAFLSGVGPQPGDILSGSGV